MKMELLAVQESWQPQSRELTISLGKDDPEVRLVGRVVYCNGHTLNLCRKPVAARLVQTFFDERNLSKRVLVGAQVGNNENILEIDRLTHFRSQTINRLISRIRVDFDEAFGEVVPAGTRWFHYDQTTRQWSLCHVPKRKSRRIIAKV
jgi:hypothetical protein